MVEPSLVQALAKARARQAKAKANLEALQARIDQAIQEHFGLELEDCKDFLALTNLAAEVARSELEKAALAEYTFTGEQHPHPAVTVIKAKQVVYEPDAALAWCRTNFPAGLKLDAKAFEGVVKSGTIQVDVAKIEIEPQVRIKTDLGAWAGEEAEA